VLLLTRFEPGDQLIQVAATLFHDAPPGFVDLLDDWIVDHSKCPRYIVNASSGVTMTRVGRPRYHAQPAAAPGGALNREST